MLLKVANSFPSSRRCFYWKFLSPARHTILLIERRDEVYARVAQDLSIQGVDVERASTPAEACAKFETTQADLIIANRELSYEESGWLLVSKWALARRQRRIWLYTARPMPFDDQWCQFTKVEKLLYHEGSIWRLSDLLLSQMQLNCAQ